MLNYIVSVFYFFLYAAKKRNRAPRNTGENAGSHPYKNRGFMKRQETQSGSGVRWFAGHILSILFVLLSAVMLCCCGKKKTEDDRNFISVPANLNNPKFTIGVVSETSSCEEAKKAFPLASFREFEEFVPEPCGTVCL